MFVHDWIRLPFLIICISLFSMRPLAAGEGEWSQWRGPKRDGQVPGPRWPAKLDEETLSEAWSVKLGPSYSGPIVKDPRVFVTETVDEEKERVTAYDRNTGDVLWTQQWEGAMRVPFFARANGSWIRATPAADDSTLFVAGMRDVLVALDIATGAEKWRIDFVESLKTPLPSFGFVSSPLVDGDELYVQAGASVIKVDKLTGKILWRTLSDGGGMNDSAFSSPVIETIGGQRQLIVQTRQAMVGLSLADGKQLWSQEVPAFRGMNIVTPTKIGEHLFTSSYGGRSFLYEIGLSDDGFAVAERWNNKVQGYMSSPVVIDGHIYLHLRNRRFACLDASTGKENWISKPFGQYWSVLAQGDRILALDERGELLLIAANPAEFELLDRKKVSEESTWAHLGYDRGQLFVRDLGGLTVYRWGDDRQASTQ